MNIRKDILVLRGFSNIIIILYHCNILLYGYNAVIAFIVLSGYLSKNKLLSVTELFIIMLIYNNNVNLYPQYYYFQFTILYIITNYFHLIVNINLTYDTKHDEYIVVDISHLFCMDIL